MARWFSRSHGGVGLVRDLETTSIRQLHSASERGRHPRCFVRWQRLLALIDTHVAGLERGELRYVARDTSLAAKSEGGASMGSRQGKARSHFRSSVAALLLPEVLHEYSRRGCEVKSIFLTPLRLASDQGKRWVGVSLRRVARAGDNAGKGGLLGDPSRALARKYKR